MQNGIQHLNKKFFLDDEFSEKFLNWPEETISPRHMFQWFLTIFHSELRNYDTKRIRKLFAVEFPTDIQLLDRANLEFESRTEVKI